jgi:putative transposase
VPQPAPKKAGFSPCSMSKPDRNASPIEILRARTFFVTTKTSMGRALLQSERNATLLIDVLRSYVAAGKLRVHDFVVMPDHVHLLITVDADMSIEKAVQLIKGGFSYRLKKEFGYTGEVWQRGFSDVRIEDRENFLRHREYIAQNPVKKGLATSVDEFPYCFTHLARQKSAGAKAQNHQETADGTTKAVP